MAKWNRRDDRGYRDEDRRITQNYADVEYANQSPPRDARRGYDPDYAHYLAGTARADARDYGRGSGRHGGDREFARMYDTATRDYAGYDAPVQGVDRASIRDEGRHTDRSAYNSESRGRDFGPDEFGRGRRAYGEAVYGENGVQSRDADFYRNRSDVYGGRPEARGWRPDEETTSFGPHRGRGPKDYKRSDERIREDVNDRLTDDRHLDASGISVNVQNGEITLTGSVDGKQDKRRAEDIADSVPGAGHVQNNLRVAAIDAGADTAGDHSASRGVHNEGWASTSTTSGNATTAQYAPNGSNPPNGSNYS